ncbi:SRPBCC family protein [Cohnella silvisoli]|uniref:SRPBCC family protein n=1 Tax=Cohnella silvisoli TaxID=2873699 RepID=A0ABV1L2N7_9BACL|nr:SRPBCC family protein [Cohnella silvisoli]MCD9021635.1 SRPBCC family protein [Cohnella silvisoli]
MSENNAKNKTTTYVEDLSIIVERTFDAPRELVWEAWTKPEHVANWWGMGGKLAACEIDLRPGGTYLYVLRGPDGNEYPFKGVYREVVKPERLVYTRIFDVEPFSIHESVVTDTFVAQPDGKTRLTFRTDFPTAEALQGSLASGAEAGAIDSMERFSEYLASLEKE